MILATTRGGREVRSSTVTIRDDRTSDYAEAAVPVTASAVAGLPAVHAAIRMAAHQVAMLQLCVWRGRKVDRRRVSTTWQARLFDSPRPNPAQTWMAFWSVLEASMTARRNAFMWFDMVDGRAASMWALHPDQVQVGWHTGVREPRYRVMVGDGWLDPTGSGRGDVVVGPDVVHHVKDEVSAGNRLVAPTPIEAHRASLGAALAQTVWQERFYSRGTGGGLVLSFPLELTEPQAQQAQIMWEASGSGVGNAHGTRVVSGGASVTQVGLSQSDAQYVESMLLSVDDAARIFSWPASLIGGGAGIGQRGGPISPEHELTRMVRYHLMPRLKVWETELTGHPYLLGPGATDYFEFDREGLIRADVATQTQADATVVQAGILLVDEVRAERGLPPLPNGMGQIPQITPVGGAPNPAAPPPPPPPVEPDADDETDPTP